MRLRQTVPYTFTEREVQALRPFFSNVNRKVFFIVGLPTAVSSALLAMYSRLKNPRGLRGHFVDNLVPLLMLNSTDESVSGPNAEYKAYQRELKERGLTTLDAVCGHDEVWANYFRSFIESAADPNFWRVIAQSGKIRDFLSMWLDAYGHNSIARTAQVVLCVEECSVLTAKSLEWSRPGAGYIELSTRYVDFSGKALYPVWDEVAVLNVELAERIRENCEAGISRYRELMGESVDGPFPTFLRQLYGSQVDSQKNLDAAVLGESCDVLGNLLPCATLTSVGMALSGEAFPQVLKHLVLDGTPENVALAIAISEEAEIAGVSHFTRHWEPTPWERQQWRMLRQRRSLVTMIPDNQWASYAVLSGLDALPGTHAIYASTPFNELLGPRPRGEFDKLPRAFEAVSAVFERYMSFRGWRDVHRMGFCAHQRALVTPEVGFYTYPKPAPPILAQTFLSAHALNQQLFNSAAGRVPPLLLQYGMAMGNLVRYQIAGNLRELEFCNWQRSKWAVNDEVRSEFLEIDRALRAVYPWWEQVSRVDRTHHYAFARGSKIVL
jgi:hypothetical protein